MLGFKLYYDKKTNQFIGEETLSEVGEPSDLVKWYLHFESMKAAVIRKNKRHKSSIDELKREDDFIIKDCCDCDESFILKKSKIDWYNKKKLQVPFRCKKCIDLMKERRNQ